MGGGGSGDAGYVIPNHGAQGWRGLLENKKALGLATFASLGGVLYGYNQGVFGQVQVMPSFESRYNDTIGDPLTKGLLTSILELGAFVGSLMAGPISDRISRKYSISAWCILFIFGTCLQAGAPNNVNFIWTGRWFAGMAVGSLSMLVPMYNGELAPPGIRGSLVSLQQLAITFGIFVSYWIAYGTSFIGGTGAGQKTAAWRIPLALQLIPALVLCVGAFFLPFSPRWLMLRGRQEECLLTLANLRNMAPEDPLIQVEFMALQAERLVELEMAQERYGTKEITWRVGAGEYWRLFSTKSLLFRLSLGVSAQSLQQWSGINAIIYYAPTIFEQVGLTGETIPLLATGIVGVVNMVATIPTVLYVDNFGRKPIMFSGATGMAICLAIVAAILSQYQDSFPQHPQAGNAAVGFIYVFIVFFAYSWGPLAWVVSAEVFPLSMRAKGMSISSGMNWLMNFTVATVTPLMIDNLRWKTYIVFMVFMIVAMFWSFFILPELKGMSLEEVDSVFGDHSGKEDAERRERVARQIGLDKAQEKAIEHVEKQEQHGERV